MEPHLAPRGPLTRRDRLRRLPPAAPPKRLLVAALLAAVVAGCSGGGEQSRPIGEPVAGEQTLVVTPEKLEAAVARLDSDVADVMERSGVPGVAVAVVADGEVVHARGYGVRNIDEPDRVDADTVFPLASLSKSVGSAVVASIVGDGAIDWTDPVHEDDPELLLADPWVTDHVTYADLYAHRSGLPDHAGDLLEDIGYDRAEVIERLRFLPLSPFRASYHYTNFGLTSAAEAAAGAAGTTWEQASQERLYGPLGMTSTSSSFEDFLAEPNRVSGHVPVDAEGDEWQVSEQQRQPDAQSPAGGVTSSVNDLARWMQMELDGGELDGRTILDAEALAETHLPHVVSNPPSTPDGRAGFYGLGFNVGYDDAGRLRLGHSGAFALGAGTAFAMLPSEDLGIVVLTNGAPLGVAETVTETFMDRATAGAPSRDWYEFMRPRFEPLVFPEADPELESPPDPEPPAALADYAGTYSNEWIGAVEVAEVDGSLVLTIGPDGQEYELQHHDGDVFTWQFRGENAGARAAVTFERDGGGPATAVTLATFDEDGLGTLERI